MSGRTSSFWKVVDLLKIDIFMRILFILTAFIALLSSSGWSQPYLLGNIGVTSVPQDSDSICLITPYLGTFDMDGLYQNQTAYDFRFYDREGNPLILSNILKQKKPVLLISGSYTCPAFRFRIPVINQLMRLYGDKINVYVVYTFEAHPFNDEQPYGDYPDADSTNQQERILYRQPRTYGERKSVADSMMKSMEIDVPIIFDGPCNEWSSHFGPASNNAYLIDTNGIIAIKQPWFDQSPDDIMVDVRNLLQKNSKDISIADSGIFSFHANSVTMTGTPGETIQIGGSLVNETNHDAIVNVARILSNMPSDWEISLCSFVCSSTYIDSASVRVLPHSSQEIKVYFYTGKNADHGSMALHFWNANIQSNEETVDFQVTTMPPLAVNAENAHPFLEVQLLPNPVQKILKIVASVPYTRVRMIDELGRIVLQTGQSDLYDISSFPMGTYYVQLFSEDHHMVGSAKFLKE